MQVPRQKERVRVDVPVTITTVLESREAIIIDLTENGAQVVCEPLPPGTRFMLDCEGHSAFATVRWAEEDRMGVRFSFTLQDGPLYEALLAARADRNAPPPAMFRAATPLPKGGFGRRA